MLDSKGNALPHHDAHLKLWIEPEFPTEQLGNPYDFQLIGGEIIRNSIIRTLVPTSFSTPKRNSMFIALQLLQIRMYRSRKRYKKSKDPTFGPYRYMWDNLETLAPQAGMNIRTLRRAIDDLTKSQIIHRIVGKNGQPNHYRFTDAAFKMAHALQFPLRFIKCEAEKRLKMGLGLVLGGNKKLAEGDDWWALMFAERSFMRHHASLFPKLMSTDEIGEHMEIWHANRDENGLLLHPEKTKFWNYWQGVTEMYLHNLRCQHES